MHVAGKNLITADTLSRAPLIEQPSEADLKQEEEVKVYIDHVIQQFPATPTKLAQIKRAQEEDECVQAAKFSCAHRVGRKKEYSTTPSVVLATQI